jgi:hypothetical protein
MNALRKWKSAATLGVALVIGVVAVAGFMGNASWSTDVRAVELTTLPNPVPAEEPIPPVDDTDAMVRKDDDDVDDDRSADDDPGVDDLTISGDGDQTKGDDGTSGGNNTASADPNGASAGSNGASADSTRTADSASRSSSRD